MRRRIGLVIVGVGIVGCGHAAPPVESPHDSPPAAIVGNAAVHARLEALPAPPTPWSTPVGTLETGDFEALCPYLVAHAHLEGGQVTCPDGSTATITEHACDAAALVASARSLPCTISLGEIVACRLAMVEHPCDGGAVGEHLEECQAFDACTCTGAPEGATP